MKVRLSAVIAFAMCVACSGGGGDGTGPGSGGGGGGGGGGSGGGACPAGSVCMLSASFTPTSLTVARGGSVNFVNESGVQHTVVFTAPRPAGVDDIGLHLSGTNTRTFGTAGRFPFRCTVHAGMDGEINVN